MQQEIPLNVLEELVQEGAYFDKGSALSIIVQDKRYGSDLESYCQQRFKFGAERARQLIAAAGVVANLKSDPTTAAVLPASEALCRPLARLDAKTQILAWQYALITVPDGRLTKTRSNRFASSSRVRGQSAC